MTTTKNTTPEALAYAHRWVHGNTTYRADDPGTFIVQGADYYHLYVTRNGRAMLAGSFGTLAEAKRADEKRAVAA